ncbi:hypothetical protein [Paenibacillus sp. N3.4]|uniref:hypothetical protein n=1 Tax=Paenibacillus sp. N3.4 TaxID=2603222 RepID=UPI0028FC8693|nr:hypothetical protein [Paenibacillus sp. N3.4]
MSLQLTPYLKLNGNAKEAIDFYANLLDAKVIRIQTYGQMGMSFPAELHDCVAHAIIKVGESDIMISDSPGIPVQTGDVLSFCLTSRMLNDPSKFLVACSKTASSSLR